MRRLRRNWSTTKTDIGQTITRIKKKSTASVVDFSEVFRPGNRRDNSQESDAASSAADPAQSASSPPVATGSEQKKKGTWALRQIRRRIALSSPPGGGASKNKEASTFFITLTIEQDELQAKYVFWINNHLSCVLKKLSALYSNVWCHFDIWVAERALIYDR